MESELIKAIPNGGQLVVFLIVVMIFQKNLQIVTSSFQDQIRGLTDTIFKVSMDTSKAVSELASAVRELQDKVDVRARRD